MKKLRYYLAEQIQDDENAETIEQLERILTIRKNRQQKLEAKTRELRRSLSDKEKELAEQQSKAQQKEENSKEEISSLRQQNEGYLSLNDIFYWKKKEVDINKSIKRQYAYCKDLQGEKDIKLYHLKQHMKVYKQAVIDAEKISLIQDEIKNDTL